MAAGSEKLSKRWVQGAKRECVLCGRAIVNLDRDVGIVRTTAEGRREIVCMTCFVRRR